MHDFFIHENLKKFIFPNAPHSWIATNTFFIEENVCSIVQDTILKKEPDVENKSTEEKKINVLQNVKIPLFHMFEDLQQHNNVKINEEEFLHICDKWDVPSLIYFSSICLKEYQKCESIVKQNQFIKKSRLFSKLILGILHVNNLFVCTLKEFKKCKDFSFQDMETLKNLLYPFDILEKEIFELGQPGKKINSDEMFFVLAHLQTKEMFGVVWALPWENSKECDYIKVEDKNALLEIQKALYVKALNVNEHKKIMDCEKIKCLLHMLLLSEAQMFQYEHVLWKPPKVGDFPCLKAIDLWKKYFQSMPTFGLEEGVQKLPKQDTSCDIFLQDIKYSSSFREVQNNIKSIEKCKKYKFMKDEFAGLYKDIKNKTITIILKKKFCFSNLFLCHHVFPNPIQFMEYFIQCQEQYEDEESLTNIEKIISI